MNVNKLLETITPGPWVADGCVVEHFDAPFIADLAVCGQPVIYGLPAAESTEAKHNAIFITLAVNNFVLCLGTLDTIADKLNRAANGGCKGTDHKERIGDIKAVMRECRNIAREVLHQMEEVDDHGQIHPR